jgi:hypothetical protein
MVVLEHNGVHWTGGGSDELELIMTVAFKGIQLSWS